MKESDLNGKARDAIRTACHGARIFKHCDLMTSGIPDTSVTWNACTSWLEFKHMEPEQDIHHKKQLKKIQLTELAKLEHHSGGRAWVIAYRKSNFKKQQVSSTLIYRPSALLLFEDGCIRTTAPVPETIYPVDRLLENLRTRGVALFNGYNHAAVAALIRQTHDDY